MEIEKLGEHLITLITGDDTVEHLLRPRDCSSTLHPDLSVYSLEQPYEVQGYANFTDKKTYIDI